MHRWSLSFGKTACAGASPVAGSLNSRDRNPSIPAHQGRRRSFQYGGATGMEGAVASSRKESAMVQGSEQGRHSNGVEFRATQRLRAVRCRLNVMLLLL